MGSLPTIPPKLQRLWEHWSVWVDQHGRVGAAWSVLRKGSGFMGGLIAATGIVWAQVQGWLGQLDAFAKLTISFGVALLIVGLIDRAQEGVRRALRNAKRPSILVLPTVTEKHLYLRVTTQKNTDVFKANLTWTGDPVHRSSLPIALKWKDVEAEYREIPRTGTEALHLLDYTIDEPETDGPPTLTYTVRSSLLENGITNTEAFSMWGAEPGGYRTDLLFSYVIVGRETEIQRFTVRLWFDWFASGPIKSQAFAEVDPSPYRKPQAMHRELR